MIKLQLMNGQEVEVSPEEINEFITLILTQNPHWRYSGLLNEMECESYLKGESTPEDLRKVARYILINFENLSFTCYLFDKADGEPERTKEFNMPALLKLRDIYRRVSEDRRTPEELAGDVHEMENLCLEMGASPL